MGPLRDALLAFGVEGAGDKPLEQALEASCLGAKVLGHRRRFEECRLSRFFIAVPEVASGHTRRRGFFAFEEKTEESSGNATSHSKAEASKAEESKAEESKAEESKAEESKEDAEEQEDDVDDDGDEPDQLVQGECRMEAEDEQDGLLPPKSVLQDTGLQKPFAEPEGDCETVELPTSKEEPNEEKLIEQRKDVCDQNIGKFQGQDEDGSHAHRIAPCKYNEETEKCEPRRHFECNLQPCRQAGEGAAQIEEVPGGSCEEAPERDGGDEVESRSGDCNAYYERLDNKFPHVAVRCMNTPDGKGCARSQILCNFKARPGSTTETDLAPALEGEDEAEDASAADAVKGQLQGLLPA